MGCKICGRSSCTSSFHSIEDQVAFDERQTMSSDVNELRFEIQCLRETMADIIVDTIEECAKTCENMVKEIVCPEECAAAVRDLKEDSNAD